MIGAVSEEIGLDALFSSADHADQGERINPWSSKDTDDRGFLLLALLGGDVAPECIIRYTSSSDSAMVEVES